MSMNRTIVSLLRLGLDTALLSVAYCLAFVVQFEGSVPPEVGATLRSTLPYVLLLKAGFLIAYRIPSLTWRFVSLIEARRLMGSLTAATGTLAAFVLACRGELQPPSRAVLGGLPLGVLFTDLPLGVLLTDLLLSLAAMLSLRVLIRSWIERTRHRTAPGVQSPKIPTLLIGAGHTGALVAKELASRPHPGLDPIGFLDDNLGKLGEIIHGLKVLGTTSHLKQIASRYGAKQALISLNKPSGRNVRRIVELCCSSGITTKVIAGITDMVEGGINLSAIRDVAIEDLLRRDPVKLDTESIAGIITSRRVVVTGAGGSIGSELCRLVCGFGPSVLVLVEQAENNLFQIHRELLRSYPGVRVIPCIADICDRDRVRNIFDAARPHCVFHAAAHKHVPVMEWNPGEAIKNNILGTKVLADVAADSGVEQFVMISTDKAVNPTSVMGATKRVAEIYIQALSQRAGTRFVAVRFGNVLGSSGSVIPIFKEQIARGGPVTVTHPEMRRYFMTIPEACQLVLEAASMGRGGEIFILDMGEPVRIVDLARDLIQLSDLSTEDVEIKFIGLRPGEKLFEELLLEEEAVRKTSHSKIFIGRLAPCDWDAVNRYVDELRELVDNPDCSAIVAKLRKVVPEYTPDSSFGFGPVSSVPQAAGRERRWEGSHGLAAPHAAPSEPATVPHGGVGIELATG